MIRYWRTGILCGLIACLGCGALSHTRAGRPSFISPPAMSPMAPPPPSTVPQGAVPQGITPESGPSLNPSTRRLDSTRISSYRLDSESGKFNPPPRSGYIELPPPADAK